MNRGDAFLLINLARRMDGAVHIVGRPLQRVRQISAGAVEYSVLPDVVIVASNEATAVCVWRSSGHERMVVLNAR